MAVDIIRIGNQVIKKEIPDPKPGAAPVKPAEIKVTPVSGHEAVEPDEIKGLSAAIAKGGARPSRGRRSS